MLGTAGIDRTTCMVTYQFYCTFGVITLNASGVLNVTVCEL